VFLAAFQEWLRETLPEESTLFRGLCRKKVALGAASDQLSALSGQPRKPRAD